MTIDVASGILAATKPDEVLLSNTVIDLAAPAELAVEDRGLHQFPGVPTRWRVFAAPTSPGLEKELNAI
jgi:class 3 adenylate cyclase